MAEYKIVDVLLKTVPWKQRFKLQVGAMVLKNFGTFLNRLRIFVEILACFVSKASVFLKRESRSLKMLRPVL